VAVVGVVAVVAAAATNAVTKAPRLCAQTATSWSSTRRLTVSSSQQTRTRFQPGTSPPNWIDRDRGCINIDNLITRNNPKLLPPTITLHNYWTPLAGQVKALEPPLCSPASLLLACQWGKHMRFNLPTGHPDKDSTNYRQRKRCGNNDKTGCNRPTLHDIRQGVLNGSIPLVVSDTAATSMLFSHLPQCYQLAPYQQPCFIFQTEPHQQQP
jgi:hypothetical protein